MKQPALKKNNKPKVCLLLNIAPLYRKAIFNILDNNQKIDFFFIAGDTSSEVVALLNPQILRGYKGTLKNKFKGNKLIWQNGLFGALKGNYDAYILTGNPGIRSNWIFMILARLMGKKVYLWTHGMYGSEKKWQLFKNKLFMKMSSGLLLYGNYAKKMLLKAGFKERKMSVVYNSLDYYTHLSLRGKYNDASFMRNYFGNDYPVIAFIGRLTPQKQLNTLIDAIGILKVEAFHVNLIFVGAGPEEDQLKKRVTETDIEDRVWFYGECYDEEMIATVLQNSKICVSPGNVGLTAIHALSYGIPVITHNYFKKQMPEFEAIRKGMNGDFFRYNDPVELSETIEKWILHASNKNKREALKQTCYKVVDEIYNPENQNRIITGRLLADLTKK